MKPAVHQQAVSLYWRRSYKNESRSTKLIRGVHKRSNWLTICNSGISEKLHLEKAQAELLFPEEYQKNVLYAVPDYAYIHGELAKKGVNLTILWEEYSAKCQTEGSVPYMCSYFCEKYGRWANVTKATMRIQHKPGDTMEVDWAGAALDIHNPVTGEVSKAYLFVAVLP